MSNIKTPKKLIEVVLPLDFDDAMQRSVKENCRVLRFGNAEFEEE